MIEIDDLTVLFGGVRGLSALTASLPEPVTGLVGPNGAGKTTLINVLSGFIRPAKGSVSVDSKDLKGIPVHKRAAFGIRRTFQNEQVVENLSAADNVAAVLDNVPTDGQPRRVLIARALDFVGLGAKASVLGRNLNAYERRMVEIARSTVGSPRLIMMDEPGAGLARMRASICARSSGTFTATVVLRCCWWITTSISFPQLARRPWSSISARRLPTARPPTCSPIPRSGPRISEFWRRAREHRADSAAPECRAQRQGRPA